MLNLIPPLRVRAPKADCVRACGRTVAAFQIKCQTSTPRLSMTQTQMATSASYDAILIGAGHNALVCAACLARAGWSTLVLERSDRAGGAVMSAELTRPGAVSDLFAT